MEADAVAAQFETSTVLGLSQQRVAANYRQYGPNVMPAAVPRSGLSIFLDQFKSLPVALLGVAAGFSLVTGGVADALVITAVVVSNAAIGYGTESQAETIIHSLKHMVHPSASVIRDGVAADIRAEDVVVGDLLVLTPGSYVSADARLIGAVRLSVDESALTGESLPAAKATAPLVRADTPLADRLNMVYRGTLVTGGQGRAVVVATGRFTEMGKVQSLVGEATPPTTPMERQLSQLGTQLALIGSGVCPGLRHWHPAGLRRSAHAQDRHLVGRGRHSRRAASRGHHHAGPWHATHAAASCSRAPSGGSRDVGLGADDLSG
jgi:Ca2+-transporting ATPase